MSLGHHLDHLIRGNAVGWPLTEQVNAADPGLARLRMAGGLCGRAGHHLRVRDPAVVATTPGPARRPASTGRGEQTMTASTPPAGQPAVRPRPSGADAAIDVGGAVLLVGIEMGLERRHRFATPAGQALAADGRAYARAFLGPATRPQEAPAIRGPATLAVAAASAGKARLAPTPTAPDSRRTLLVQGGVLGGAAAVTAPSTRPPPPPARPAAWAAPGR